MTDQGKLRVMRTARGLTHRNALRKKVQRVTIERLTFLSDHGLIADNLTDWRPGGTLYTAQMGGAHWTPERSFPASFTKRTTVTVAVELRIEGADVGPLEGTLHGKPSGAEPFLEFEGTFPIGAAVPTTRVELTAKGALPDEVADCLARSLRWTATIGAQTFDLGATGPHDLFVTFDTPVPAGVPLHTPFGPEPAPLEDGITHKRLAAAVRITREMALQAPRADDPDTGEPMDPHDPHVIARILIATVPGYTIEPDASVPAELGHPHYYNETPGMAQAGAWPIVDFRAQRAECQAIVRYVRGMLLQIGCPGEAHMAVVYAHADVDQGKTALEDSLLPPDPDASKYRFMAGRMRVAGGLNRNQMRSHLIDGAPVVQLLALADREVAVGELIPPGSVFNSYEACLKFTHGGTTRYLGGGVPAGNFKEPADVIKVFYGLVWLSQIRSPETGAIMNRVDEIVCTYR
ncbi:hypothetical protein [Sorangium sp. So ce363]|uniref:hypothetical protein n=1 Tax=Sorangium sp. So ce363 TaxID=3133304 RepID=UPI003F60017C